MYVFTCPIAELVVFERRVMSREMDAVNHSMCWTQMQTNNSGLADQSNKAGDSEPLVQIFNPIFVCNLPPKRTVLMANKYIYAMLRNAGGYYVQIWQQICGKLSGQQHEVT